MFTSYFANVANIPEGLRAVAIARGVPKGFTGRLYQRLAPSWAMLKMGRPEYDRLFAGILARLDPHEVYRDLGDDAVLLCWERPNLWCHRRMVAEWLEEKLGVCVPELGLPREGVLRYNCLPAAQRRAAKKKGPPTLF